MRHPEINIAVFGHAKHGKSTLAGRLLHEFGSIDAHKLAELEAKARLKGKDYNAYNLAYLEKRPTTYAKDTNKPDDESRTVFPERGNVELKDGRIISLIDTPGFSRFVSNIIYGAHLSDMAILVVEASAGVEAGTINIVRILKAFGIPILGIVISKMDIVGYAQVRFEEICEEIRQLIFPLIDENGALPEIIPICSLTGEGIRSFDKIDWFHGNSILSVIEQARTQNSASQLDALHFAVEGSQEVHSLQGIGTVVVGSLETGILNKNTKLFLEPTSTIQGKSIEYSIKSMQYAKSITDKNKQVSVDVVPARAIVAVALPHLHPREAREYFKRGVVFGTKAHKPSVANEINAEIIFFEPETVYEGKEYILYTNASHCTIQITGLPSRDKIEFFIHTRSNKMRDQVYANQALEAEVYETKLKFRHPICIESDPRYQRLTRFVLKSNNKIVACGRCTSIES